MGLQDMMENDMTNIIQPDPKSPQDLVDVLLRFTRYPVAFVCGSAGMNLRIGVRTRSTIPETALEIIEPIRKAKESAIYLCGIWNQLTPFPRSICKSTTPCKKEKE